MNDAQKDAAVAEWEAVLHDRQKWIFPSSHYRYLLRYADRLQAIGAIDALERFDLVEVAMSAFCHFIDEQPQWRHPASTYDVYNLAGQKVGSLNGTRYFLHSENRTLGPMDFFAQIEEKDGEQKIITQACDPYGVLRDRYIDTETGQRLVLVETGRMFNGVMRTRLDDPDVYRAIVDASIVAIELGQMSVYVELWEKESFSIFTQCSRCCDRFDLREDCPDCDGQGFVEDPQCPSRLPTDIAKRLRQEEAS